MQISELLKMDTEELDNEISKQKKKIKDAKESIQLLERLKKSAVQTHNNVSPEIPKYFNPVNGESKEKQYG